MRPIYDLLVRAKIPSLLNNKTNTDEALPFVQKFPDSLITARRIPYQTNQFRHNPMGKNFIIPKLLSTIRNKLPEDTINVPSIISFKKLLLNN
jgi:hypothetical protein